MLVAKYKEISEILVEELKKGQLRPGDRFYSEAELKKRFNVSSTTAVKVLNYLESKNIVTRVQGKGTFVAKESHKNIVLLTDLNLANGKPENVKVLSVKIDNNSKIKKIMSLKADDNYVKIRRLRFFSEKVVQYSISFINQNFIDLSLINKLEAFTSIYQRIRNDSGIDPYLLIYSQKTVGKIVKDEDILKYFPDQKSPSTFIKQERSTYLPFAQSALLEYTISYKLPEFWGIQVDASTLSNNTKL